MHSFSATQVKRRLHRGSSSPVLVETEGGRFVVKLRGAGDGVPALLAEILVAELAERLSLPVPERALIELPRGVPSDDRNDEVSDLLGRSAGTNLGVRFLDGAREPDARQLAQLDDELVGRVLWLDGLVMNADRTVQNPNILLWKHQPWLIDHGASLAFHHDWDRVTEDAPRERADYGNHVFSGRVSLLQRYDSLLAKCLTADALRAAVETVPDEFVATRDPGSDARRGRAAYHAFLWKRLKPPRPFVEGPSPAKDD